MGGPPIFTLFPYRTVCRSAEDSFLPRWLSKRGHRLVFSNGIIVLAIAAIASTMIPLEKTTRCPRRSEEHTSELQSHLNLVSRLLLEKKKTARHLESQSQTH